MDFMFTDDNLVHISCSGRSDRLEFVTYREAAVFINRHCSPLCTFTNRATIYCQLSSSLLCSHSQTLSLPSLTHYSLQYPVSTHILHCISFLLRRLLSKFCCRRVPQSNDFLHVREATCKIQSVYRLISKHS